MKKILSCVCSFALAASCFSFAPIAWADQPSDSADNLDAVVAEDDLAEGGQAADEPGVTDSVGPDDALPAEDGSEGEPGAADLGDAVDWGLAEGDKAADLKAAEPETQGDEIFAEAMASQGGQEMYRLYNPNSGEHFYTANVTERNNLYKAGWEYEGIGWVAPNSGANVYRLYNPNAGDHHYTQNATERDMLLRAGWSDEGVGWKTGGPVALYRQYNPNAAVGSHNFTTNKAEDQMLARNGWKAEGVGWYGVDAGRADSMPLDIVRPTSPGSNWVRMGDSYFYRVNGAKQTGWVVTDMEPSGARGSLERYYLNPSTGALVKGFINAGGGHFAFSKPSGAVVRGAYRDPSTGYWYFADNDGKLLSPGWHVTDAFGQGLQRYYIDAKAHAAVPGTSNDGWRHYTRADTGYVARGRLDLPDGRILVANDNGKLADKGWLITTALGNGLQRYYITDDGATAIGFFRVDGKPYYGIPVAGYVLRGKRSISGNGHTQVFLADNEGVLADKEGWLVTGAYDNGALQRYRIDSSVAPGYYGAHVGKFTIDGKDYYGRDDQGYVVRGLYRAPNGNVYYGNEDGVLGNIEVSDDPELNQILTNILARKGTSLPALFSYVASYRYISGSKFPTGNWSVPFAKEMYYNDGGNCYRYAALFCWLARAVGYDANVVSGYVPSRSQGWAPHGWVEIHINGTTYVCDPDLAHEIPGRNWYMFTYGSAPTTYRH